MLSPLPRCSDGRSCLAHPFRRISLPRKGRQVGLHIVCFEACSAFTRVTACTLALSPYFVTRFTRRLQPFRYLHDCSGCFRLERLPGGTCTHWKSAALSRRTPPPAVDALKLERREWPVSSDGAAIVRRRTRGARAPNPPVKARLRQLAWTVARTAACLRIELTSQPSPTAATFWVSRPDVLARRAVR